MVKKVKTESRILITGGDGMLASYFKRFSKTPYIYMGRKDLDVSSWNQVKKLLDIQISGIIHLAAVTDVDWCETNKSEAFRINTEGTKHVVELCKRKNTPLIFIGTSAIFNGNSKVPYIEFDRPDPANHYGYTKLEAEKIIKGLDDFAIIRLGWLIGKKKKFLYYILKQIEENVGEIKAISDVKGTITYAYDAVKFIELILKNREQGVFHLASRGSCSRYELAREIVRVSEKEIRVSPVLSKEFASAYPAPRPKNESIESVRKILNFEKPDRWEKKILDIKRMEGFKL